MSEHDEQRPMTRRERRMREMGLLTEEQPTVTVEAADTAAETEVTEPPAAAVPEDQPAAQDPPAEQTEISPYNEDGTLRTRAEMRALRAQAEAEEAEAEEAQVDDAAPTQQFTVSDLIEAEASAEETSFEELVEEAVVEEAVVEEVSVEEDSVEEVSVEEVALESVEEVPEVPEAAPEADPQPKRFGWRRGKRDRQEAAAEAPVEEAADQPTEALETHEASAPETEAGEETEHMVDVAPIFDEIPDAKPDVLPDGGVAPEAAVPVADPDEEEAQATKAEYSFPDIQPPEEWRSVFDDPGSRRPGDPEEASSEADFDALIERAVAQEGTTASTGASALIMPSNGDDTGGLAGPLGTTGELFVTGSIELPQALAETGGHTDVHDSLRIEPVVTEGDHGYAASDTDVSGPAPVAAKSAVSARMPSDMPFVAAHSKETSKLPLILSLTGGGLLIVVIGLGVWAWQSGALG